jgi:hypothetical protein
MPGGYFRPRPSPELEATYVMQQHERDVDASREQAQRPESGDGMRRRVPWVVLGLLVVVAVIVGGVVLLVMR